MQPDPASPAAWLPGCRSRDAAVAAPLPPRQRARVLIDELVTAYDARTTHHIRVRAAPARVYDALHSADLGRHRLVRALLFLRALPATLLRPSRLRELRARAAQPITLAAFEAHGFIVLAADPPRELVLGLEGAFWKPGGGLRAVDAAAFRAPVPPGVARAAWTFSVTADGTAGSVLATETRIATGDAAARRRFRAYWLLVRPGSGLIRRLMLRSIGAEAERAAGASA